MDNSTDKYFSRLLEISNKKYKLLNEMFLLTQKQSEAIINEDMPNLEILINSKQAKIDEIDKLDEEFNVYFQRVKQTLKILKLDDLKGKDIKGLKELQETIASIMGLLEEISVMEKRNSLKAEQHLNGFEAEIKKISQGQKMNSVYKPSSTPLYPSYYIDKKK